MGDHEDKFRQHVEDALKETLKHHICEKVDPEELKSTVNKFFEKLAPKAGVKGEVTEIIGDTIKYKLSMPSFVEQIIPPLKGPFSPWHEDGVVHIAGRLGDVEVRVCDYRELQPGGYGLPDMVITCLSCLVMNINTTAA
jgi:uncharacterized protein YihD (DUF1040 family)